MATKTRTTLKGFFETGDIPTQQNYADLIDSKLNLIDTDVDPQIVSSGISASSFISETHITASGNISASGNYIGVSGSFTHIAVIGDVSASNHTGSFGHLIVSDFGNMFASGHISASGNISSSGNIIATQLTGSLNATDITVGGDISVANIVATGNISASLVSASEIRSNSHITASGNVSASGNILGTDITVADDLFVKDDIVRIGDADASIKLSSGYKVEIGDVEGTTNSTILTVDDANSKISTTHQLDVTGLITASGNITSAKTGSFQVLDSPAFIGSRPIQTKTGDGALVITDAGTYNRCGAHKLTIPLNSAVAFAIGTEIDFIQTAASGHLLVTASAGEAVTLNSRNQLFSASGQFSAISCKKVGTDEWDVIGDLTA